MMRATMRRTLQDAVEDVQDAARTGGVLSVLGVPEAVDAWLMRHDAPQVIDRSARVLRLRVEGRDA